MILATLDKFIGCAILYTVGSSSGVYKPSKKRKVNMSRIQKRIEAGSNVPLLPGEWCSAGEELPSAEKIKWVATVVVGLAVAIAMLVAWNHAYVAPHTQHIIAVGDSK